MNCNKETIRIALRVTAFLLILSLLFLFFTYLFRDTSQHKRQIILEYYNEPEDSLDVVFIGASNVIRYWDPMRAWNEYGIASYNYATSSMTGATYLAAIKDALRTQTPKLVVMDTRRFGWYYDSSHGALEARHLLDCMDYDFSRFQAAKYYSDTLELPWEERLQLYIDLIYYHTNYEALITPLNWELADNRLDADTPKHKGYLGRNLPRYFEDPTPNLTDAVGQLDKGAERLFVDILNYCQEEEIPLLLLASPMIITTEESALFNAIDQIAQEYGVPFLNTNLCYEEIGLDFSRDFYDAHHANILGADKFTDFIAEYLLENYDIPDRREDPDYASWKDAYAYYKETTDQDRNNVRKLLDERDQALEDGIEMRNTTDPLKWFALADNTEFTLFFLAKEPCANAPSPESKLLLKNFGVKADYWEKPFAVVYQGKVLKNGTWASFSGTVGEDKLNYTISAKKEPTLQIDETDYIYTGSGDIQVIAYSNSLDSIYDQIVITTEPDGSVRLTHH